ncbi:hypothetical protein AIOL_002228 [Candidatus Rhodobacter oscarellae]|uniref:Uncharacterized protein n=2 Tax=Candidatus Rhodobacter oscarellae TaxID=1675527 RepID=A0A0J9E3J2_9RHOB|nr:hypothetical protein AIOL_002228 [Candidatus Rhodobacter lobularis]
MCEINLPYLKDGVFWWGIVLASLLVGLLVLFAINVQNSEAMDRIAAAFGVPLAASGLAWGHFFKAKSQSIEMYRELHSKRHEERRCKLRKQLAEFRKEASGIYWGVRAFGVVFVFAVIGHASFTWFANGTIEFAVASGLITMAIGNIWGHFFERAVEIRARHYFKGRDQKGA